MTMIRPAKYPEIAQGPSSTVLCAVKGAGPQRSEQPSKLGKRRIVRRKADCKSAAGYNPAPHVGKPKHLKCKDSRAEQADVCPLKSCATAPFSAIEIRLRGRWRRDNRRCRLDRVRQRGIFSDARNSTRIWPLFDRRDSRPNAPQNATHQKQTGHKLIGKSLSNGRPSTQLVRNFESLRAGRKLFLPNEPKKLLP
jgi:hypothetical protein